jgi:hypothetical protein
MLGLKQSTLVQQVIERGEEPEEESKPEPKNVYEERIAKLEATISQDRMTRMDNDLLGRVRDVLKGKESKFSNVAADPSLHREVINQLISFTKEAGHPPGDTIEESIQMAIEAVEAREEATAQKYLKRKGLTQPKTEGDTGIVGSKSAVAPAASELAKTSRTLTNSHASSPRTVGSTPAETPDELRAKALKMLEAQGD